MPITYTSNEQIEVYRFSAPAAITIPLLALAVQAFLPRWLPVFNILDLPFLVVVFFALARRRAAICGQRGKGGPSARIPIGFSRLPRGRSTSAAR